MPADGDWVEMDFPADPPGEAPLPPGIDEGPVTGSAHCTLAVFWAERLGRTELVGEQGSARGGTVRMRLRGERVALSGQAVTVGRVERLV